MCHFCNEDIVMKSWAVGMNQTREKLRSLNLHLTKKHEVARKKRVMLLVGDLSLKEQKFLELSLEQYFVNIGGYPFTYVCCAFCGKKFHLEREHTKKKPYNCEISQCKFRLKYHIHCHKRRKHWHEKRFLL